MGKQRRTRLPRGAADFAGRQCFWECRRLGLMWQGYSVTRLWCGRLDHVQHVVAFLTKDQTGDCMSGVGCCILRPEKRARILSSVRYHHDAAATIMTMLVQTR